MLQAQDKPYWSAALLAVGLTIATPTLAQIGIPSTTLNKPVEHCFDQFQRLITARWDEQAEKHFLDMNYTYHLLLDQEAHIDKIGDIFVYFQWGDIWFLDGKTMNWVFYGPPKIVPEKVPPTYFSGALSALTPIAIKLPMDAALTLEKNSQGMVYVGYGLRETPTSTAYDSFDQMLVAEFFKPEAQSHLIWSGGLSNPSGMVDYLRICLTADKIRYFARP